MYGFELNSSRSECYNPTYQACFNNSLCDRHRTCNQQCLPYNQVCVNNVIVCNVSGYYFNYETNQIQLCNGVCYDSAIQKCVDGYILSDFTSNSPTTTAMTPTSNSSSFCSVKECTKDDDCCVPGVECQCFQHNNQGYGSCLNPNVLPTCTKGCPVQQCRNDTNCCKCQCGQITATEYRWNGGYQKSMCAALDYTCST